MREPKQIQCSICGKEGSYFNGIVYKKDIPYCDEHNPYVTGDVYEVGKNPNNRPYLVTDYGGRELDYLRATTGGGNV